jgi:alpha-tubulin suppressor-like RCC1 family protein
VTGWRHIVAISTGDWHTVGLKADGTLVAVGQNDHGQCDVTGWRDIVAISTGKSHTMGLKADGTVVAVGYNGYGECDVSGWTDIVAISAGGYHTVGLRADGTVVATKYTGDYYHGQCDVSGWKFFNSIDTLEQDQEEARRIAEEKRIRAEEEAHRIAEEKRQTRIASLNSEKETLSTELSNLRGLFSGRRRREIESRLAEIAAELSRLS